MKRIIFLKIIISKIYIVWLQPVLITLRMRVKMLHCWAAKISLLHFVQCRHAEQNPDAGKLGRTSLACSAVSWFLLIVKSCLLGAS